MQTKHVGDLTITAANAEACRHLTEVTGWLDIRADATLTAPLLRELSGRALPADDIAAQRIRDVASAALVSDAALDMSDWHSCATTHCIAGWAIHQAGAEGYKLERDTSPATAGALLLGLGAAHKFHVSTSAAREWLSGFHQKDRADGET